MQPVRSSHSDHWEFLCFMREGEPDILFVIFGDLPPEEGREVKGQFERWLRWTQGVEDICSLHVLGHRVTPTLLYAQMGNSDYRLDECARE